MFNAETKKIGGCEYKVTQLGAVKGRGAFLRLVKCLGPMLAGLAGKGGKVADIDVGALFSRLDLTEDDLTFFCDTFAEKTFVTLPDGKMPRLDKVFDEHFAGSYSYMVQWLAFAVKVNFADFFDGLSSAPASPPDTASSQPADNS